MPLLKVYQETIIPALERNVVQKYSENNVKIVVVKQEDGAGLHTNSTYQKEMKKEFNQRDWILFNQPSQSSITNVHDACIFPMMSKKVSKEQAVVFGSTLLKGEQLNQCVTKVWNDENNRTAMARAFAGHHQIVNAILHHNGDNSYLTKKGGLSFGVRKSFVCDEDGNGVIPIEYQEEDTQTAVRKAMKYPEPKLTDLPKKPVLREEMVALLKEYMEVDLMSDELIEAWAEEIASAD